MHEKQANTQNTRKAIGYVFIILLMMLAIAVWCFYIRASWTTVLEYSLLGIPFGVVFWSCIGNLIRIILTIQSASSIESPFRWIFIRSCLSIFVGTAISFIVLCFFIPIGYSALYFIAFVVGLSDLPFNLVGALQNTIAKDFNGPLDEEQTLNEDKE